MLTAPGAHAPYRLPPRGPLARCAIRSVAAPGHVPTPTGRPPQPRCRLGIVSGGEEATEPGTVAVNLRRRITGGRRSETQASTVLGCVSPVNRAQQIAVPSRPCGSPRCQFQLQARARVPMHVTTESPTVAAVHQGPGSSRCRSDSHPPSGSPVAHRSKSSPRASLLLGAGWSTCARRVGRPY
jgi:hypothetical protein